MNAGIDAHVHLWERAVDPQDWIDAQTMLPIARDFGASDLSEMLASTGLDRAVVVQSSNSLDESIRLAKLDSPAIAASSRGSTSRRRSDLSSTRSARTPLSPSSGCGIWPTSTRTRSG
ncbi:hypothetical protein ACFQ51_44280 [Streptomyces kaempferi]